MIEGESKGAEGLLQLSRGRGADASAGVPEGHNMDPQSFIVKAFTLVNTSAPEVCAWNQTGDSFIIKDPNAFSDLLPHFFKHRNLRSFVRQLNFYGFRKIKGEAKLVPSDRPQHWSEFKHEYFKRDNPSLLSRIKRVGATEQAKNVGSSGAPPPLTELQAMHAQIADLQSTVDTLTGLVTQLVAERAQESGRGGGKRARIGRSAAYNAGSGGGGLNGGDSLMQRLEGKPIAHGSRPTPTSFDLLRDMLHSGSAGECLQSCTESHFFQISDGLATLGPQVRIRHSRPCNEWGRSP